MIIVMSHTKVIMPSNLTLLDLLINLQKFSSGSVKKDQGTQVSQNEFVC